MIGNLWDIPSGDILPPPSGQGRMSTQAPYPEENAIFRRFSHARTPFIQLPYCLA